MGETMFSRNTDAGRVYDWKGEEYVSVTTAIKNGVSKPDLLGWAAKQVASIAVRDKDTVYSDSTEDHIGNILAAFEGVRDASAETGNIVHGLCEQIANGEVIDPSTLDVAIAPFIEAFYQFLSDWKPRYVEAEAFIVSKKFGYAGTLDAIVEINGENYVLDIKTGRSIHPEVALQLSAYANADFIGRVSGEESSLPVLHRTKGLVLHLRPGKYSLYPCRIDNQTFDAFLSALDMHHYEKFIKHFLVGPKMTIPNPEAPRGTNGE